METIQIDLFTFFGVMELALILIVSALFLWLRGRKLAQRVQVLEKANDESAQEPHTVSFDQYLRDEVIRNQAFIDQAAASQDKKEQAAKPLLEARKQFLELELAAQGSAGNPVEFCRTVAEGIRGLVEQLRPEPETRVEVTPVEAQADPQEEQSQGEEETPVREVHDTHDEELDHLRQVINNQQDAMAALRGKLRENEDQIDGMDGILEKLDEFERQSLELHQSLEVLEAENERLKQAREKNAPAADGGIAPRDPAQLKGLNAMVGKQQATISTLQDLIRELAPEANKARELQEAIARIEHTNDELNGCVAVLEDENAMLRKELEQIQAILEEQEKAAAETDAAEAEAEVAEAEAAEAEVAEAEVAEAELDDAQADQSPEDAMREMTIKVQELEALVEFKDAAIEEMEKQYNALQAKYLAATGKKKAD